MTRLSRKAEREAAGAWLKAERLARNISQADLGRVLKISQSQVSKVEQGLHRFPLDRLSDVGAVFGLTVEEVVELMRKASEKKIKPRKSRTRKEHP